jgi:hypothetical protein
MEADTAPVATWHDNPHRYFGERKAGTYLSFLNLP